MATRKQVKQRRVKAEQKRRRSERLRQPDGWQPPPPPEAAWLDLLPTATADEPLEDRAVFDPAAAGTLPDDLARQATLVRESLELVSAGHDQAAVDRMGSISRQSPFAEWRLFVRGQVAFQAGDGAAAREAWSRLDPIRRPARIARTLGDAWEGLQAKQKASTSSARAAGEEARRGAAAAARELLGRQSMWDAAAEIAAVRHRSAEKTFSASQAAMLIRFVKQFRGVDPSFTQAFAAACRQLAALQPDQDIFESLVRGVPGPPDDPRCLREKLVYMWKFYGSASDAEGVVREYVDRELPTLRFLPEPMRRALASQTLTRMAREMTWDGEGYDFALVEGKTLRKCERFLREALERYPLNREAHLGLLELIEGKIDAEADEDQASTFEDELTAAKKAYVEQFPDAHEHLLEVIDDLIISRQFDQAQPLVDRLEGQRGVPSLLRFLPWRFAFEKLSWSAEQERPVEEVLAAMQVVLTRWPQPVSRAWIPVLEAVLASREGQGSDDTLRELAIAAAGGGPDASLLGDVMLSEALRRLKGSPAAIKACDARLRRACDADAIDGSLGPLLAAGSFYGSLERCGLMIDGPALPSEILGKRLAHRLAGQGKWKLTGRAGGAGSFPVEDPDFWPAFEWLGDNDFFDAISLSREPKALGHLADTEPQAAAALLAWRARKAASSLSSRRWTKRLKMLTDAIAAGTAGPNAERFGRIVEAVEEAREEIQRRKRMRSTTRIPRGARSRKAAMPDGPLGMPPVLRLILERGGPKELTKVMELLDADTTPKSIAQFGKLCERLDISQQELMASMNGFMSFDDDDEDDDDEDDF